ncbi:MAG TPA: DUF72 domain-containing protein [Candidatus Xenobia bacterium]|nr:DUF72 domain-containing protein [Candidatus Xenobia bacterium]
MTSGAKAALRVGTSGYAYKPWKGPFYPEKLPDKQMLSFYAQRFPTVEINNTFYRMPTERLLAGWAGQVPSSFQFVLKLNQQITHIQRLRGVEASLKRFLEVSQLLASEGRLGPILVQLPPNFRADLPLLDAFLRLRPSAFRLACEFRHTTWYTEDTYTLLRRHGVALCLAETDEDTPPDVLTADFVYARLRRESYTPKQLRTWKERFDKWVSQGVDVYAFLKHEDAGKAPEWARKLLEFSW